LFIFLFFLLLVLVLPPAGYTDGSFVYDTEQQQQQLDYTSFGYTDTTGLFDQYTDAPSSPPIDASASASSTTSEGQKKRVGEGEGEGEEAGLEKPQKRQKK
jgi:hypothetical protein